MARAAGAPARPPHPPPPHRPPPGARSRATFRLDWPGRAWEPRTGRRGGSELDGPSLPGAAESPSARIALTEVFGGPGAPVGAPPRAASSSGTRSTSRARSGPRGCGGLSTSSTSIRRSRRRRPTCTRRGSTARRTAASCGRRHTTTGGMARRGRVPRHARPTARGSGRISWRRQARSGCTSTGARRISCGCCSTRSSGERRSSTRSSGDARPTSAGRPRATSSGARSTRWSSTGGPLAKARAPDAARADRAVGRANRRRGASLHDGAARGLHRRVDRAARRRGARAPDGERAGVREVLPREERRRDARAARDGSMRSGRTCRRSATRARESERGFPRRSRERCSIGSIACACPEAGLVVDVFGGQRHDRRERSCARSPLRPGRRVAAGARDRPRAPPASQRVVRRRALRTAAVLASHDEQARTKVRVEALGSRVRIELASRSSRSPGPSTWRTTARAPSVRPGTRSGRSARASARPPGGDRRRGHGTDRRACLARRRTRRTTVEAP